MLERVSAIARRIETFRSESLADLSALGLGVDDILSVQITRGPIEAIVKNLTDLKADFELQLAPEGAKSLYVMHESLRKEITALQGKLDEPNRLFAENQEALRTWQRGYDAIVGSPKEPPTIQGLEERIKLCQEAPSELAQLRIERTVRVKEIYEVIGSLATAYRKLYRGVNEFIDSHPLARDAYKLEFDLKIVDTGFKIRFFDAIHQGVAGSFYGTDSGAALLDSMLANRTFDDWNSVEGVLSEVIDALGHNKRDNDKEIKITAQLKRGKGVVEFYDFIFGLDYFAPRYLLQIDGKGLNQLSPGERGLLLLVFYLLIDRGDTPLVIDQPEENLDNQTIYRSLVPCLKEARDRRQVIIVTHNPNVAVVSDADQVICADLDKLDNYRMKYYSGSVEDPKINQLIVDVLEGTKPAFQNREAKYM